METRPIGRESLRPAAHTSSHAIRTAHQRSQVPAEGNSGSRTQTRRTSINRLTARRGFRIRARVAMRLGAEEHVLLRALQAAFGVTRSIRRRPTWTALIDSLTGDILDLDADAQAGQGGVRSGHQSVNVHRGETRRPAVDAAGARPPSPQSAYYLCINQAFEPVVAVTYRKQRSNMRSVLWR
ncbi:hypothetical protein M433DRAFT_7850 [Acidomyces richmondensis BFW]|nr:hypothetical protein M433DRAFT_7850 [Acidomyces richmondensis BFW]